MKLSGRINKVRDTRITIDKFDGGYNNLVDEARMDTKFAVESNNMIQVQDGIWKTRWGRKYYGPEYPANPDGASEFVKSDATTELIVISNGKAYKSTDGGAITEISGATFTAGIKCYFMQITGYLYIANGTDDLARYDGSVLTKYTQIAAPANLTASLTASGLTSGVYTYYAQVTGLNTIGETVGSTEASITTNKIRDSWTAGTDQIVWSWNAVSGATRYQLYLSDQAGYENLLGNSDITNFTDDGTADINPYIEVPDDNTTGAPKFTSMCVSSNRIWATNNANDMYKVYFSGTGQFIGTFSDFYGGGWINLEKGGRETPVVVKHYQSGSGDGRATVLAKTPDGRGAVWQITISSATVGSSTFSVPSATKIVGSWGTEAVGGVVATDNDIGFPNRKGWFYLGPQQNYYGILRTREMSSNIRPYWRNLNGANIKNIVAYYYDAKTFISVATGTAGNDRTIVLDSEKKNNWSVDWSFGSNGFLEYTDTTGNTHFLSIPVSGTKLEEISENFLGDFGGKVSFSYISPLIPVSENKTDIMNFREAVVELGRPKGTINFQVLGVGKNDSFNTIATATVSSFGANTGVGTDLAGELYPSETRASASGGAGAWAVYLLEAPSVFAQATTKKAIKKRAKLYSLQFKVYSNTADTQYSLLSLQAKGRLVNRRLPSGWTN